MSSAKSARSSPTTSTTAADQLSQLMKKSKPDAETGSVPVITVNKQLTYIFIRWIPYLGAKIADEGFELMADDHVPVPSQYRMLFNVTHLLALEDVVAANAPNTAEFIGTNEMLKTLKVEFMEKGVSIDQEFICVVARRPTA